MRIAILFEFPSLNGGEHSMLAVMDQLRHRGVEFVALGPEDGPLKNALKSLGVEHQSFNVRDPLGQRRPMEKLIPDLHKQLLVANCDLLHANSLSMGRLTGAIAETSPIPTVAHLRDIIKLSRKTIADLNANTKLIAVSKATRNFHISQGLDAKKVVTIYNGVDCERFQPRRHGAGLKERTKLEETSTQNCPPHPSPLPPGERGQDRANSLAPTERGLNDLTVPNACEKSESLPQAKCLRQELGLSSEDFLILTVGQIGLRKGQEVLIEAAGLLANRLARVHYLLAGKRYSDKPESREFQSRLIANMSAMGLGENLHLLGYREDMPSLMNAVDVLVHPAHQEPLGRVLLEAAASCLPIIATDVGGTSEILRDRESALLIPSANADALADAILELANDAELRTSLAANARLHILEAFALQTAADNLYAFWKSLLG